MDKWISKDELLNYLDEYGRNSYEHIAYEVVDNLGCVEYVDITPDSDVVFTREDVGRVYVIN